MHLSIKRVALNTNVLEHRAGLTDTAFLPVLTKLSVLLSAKGFVGGRQVPGAAAELLHVTPDATLLPYLKLEGRQQS